MFSSTAFMENSEQILYNISNLIRENRQNGGNVEETGFKKIEEDTECTRNYLPFPVIIFFMFTQKFFVQGIATSGIKS